MTAIIKKRRFSEGVEVESPTDLLTGSAQKCSFDDASTWNGTAYTQTYNLNSLGSYTVNANDMQDARHAQWVFLDAANNYAKLDGAVFTMTSATGLVVTFDQGYPPASGTYRIVGIG